MKRDTSWLKPFLQNIFCIDFLVGCVVPLCLYLLLTKVTNELFASLLSTCFTIAYFIICLIFAKNIGLFSMISFLILMISCLGLVLFKENKFFIYRGILDEFILFLVFSISLILKKPIMRYIVEKANDFPIEIKKSSVYNRIWKVETIIWLVYYIIWFIVQFILIKTVKINLYYTLQVVIGRISFIILLCFSFIYASNQFSKFYSDISTSGKLTTGST